MARYEGRSHHQGTMLQQLERVQAQNRRPTTVLVAGYLTIALSLVWVVLGFICVFDAQSAVDWVLTRPRVVAANPQIDPELERAFVRAMPWGGASLALDGLIGILLALRVLNRRRLARVWLSIFAVGLAVVCTAGAVLPILLPWFFGPIIVVILLNTGPGRAWFRTAPRLRR